MNNTYIIDLKNFTAEDKLREILKKFKIKKLSERTYEAIGDLAKIDIARLYQYILGSGHIFIYDVRNKEFHFYQRGERGRRRYIAQDADLDIQTLQRIEQIQED